MPHLKNWDEFAEKTKDLYHNNPDACRITLKYRHKDGKLNLKATDNNKVFQYQADQKNVKNIDKLMANVMKDMTKS